MRARTLRISFLALALGAGACHGGTSSAVTADPDDQVAPSVWGSAVVWEDYRNGLDADVYLRDLSSSTESLVAGGPGEQGAPVISTSFIAWEDGEDISGFDRATGRQISVVRASGAQYGPRLCGAIAVWTDMRAGNPDVYARDLSGVVSGGSEIRVATSAATEAYPDCDGRRIVFVRNTSSSDIHLYDIDTRQTSVLSAESWTESRPRISGDVVVWQALVGANGYGVYGKNLSSGQAFTLNQTSGHQQTPDIDGSLVVFQNDIQGSPDVWFKDLLTGQTEAVTGGAASQLAPAVSLRRFVYQTNEQGNWDVSTGVVG